MEVPVFWIWIFSIIIFLVAYLWYITVPVNLPPGSAGVPILGYLPFLGKGVYITFTQLGRKYGKIFHLYLGSRLAIVLYDFEAIKMALVKRSEEFAGRSPDADFEETNGEHSGILFTDGEYWRQHRRFIRQTLKDYGVGKPTLEPLLLEEIQHFLNELRKHGGRAIELKDYLSRSFANIIHILVTGKRYEYDHPSIQAILQSFKEFEQISGSLQLVTFFPWAKPALDRLFFKRAQILRKIKDVNSKLVEKTINDAKSKFIDGQNENYLQAYLTERNHRLKSNKNESIFTELGLVHNTRDLLVAGTDTIATTVAWAAIYMAVYPHIQKQIQSEIDRVIGHHREPSYNDRANTSFTEATICELHRVISLAPLSIPHRTTQETTLFGYTIPKDAMVFPNIWAVHNDPKLWGDPQNFRPERFIGPNGECIKPEYLIPFSMGKRACAGEPLAKMELYLYFVSLLQNFSFCPPDGVTLSLHAENGFTRQPKSLFVCVNARESACSETPI